MTRRFLPFLLVLAAVCTYPLVVIAEGTPRFPHVSECVLPPREGTRLEAVFGRFRDRALATARLRRVRMLGFKGSEIERDGCAFFKVAVHGIPSVSVGESLVQEARGVGLHPTLESLPGDQ